MANKLSPNSINCQNWFERALHLAWLITSWLILLFPNTFSIIKSYTQVVSGTFSNWLVCLGKTSGPTALLQMFHLNCHFSLPLHLPSRCLSISLLAASPSLFTPSIHWQDERHAVLFCFFLCFSGLTWPAEVALQHQPAAAEPPSADEGGGGRSRQGQRTKFILKSPRESHSKLKRKLNDRSLYLSISWKCTSFYCLDTNISTAGDKHYSHTH